VRERYITGLTRSEQKLVLGVLDESTPGVVARLEPTQAKAYVKAVDKLRSAVFLREDELDTIIELVDDRRDVVLAQVRDKLRTLFVERRLEDDVWESLKRAYRRVVQRA